MTSCHFSTIEGKKRSSLVLKTIFHLNQRDQTKPLSIFLVKSGPTGNHLLFRYPFEVPNSTSVTEVNSGQQQVRRNNSVKDATRNVQQPSRNGQQQTRIGQQTSFYGQSTVPSMKKNVAARNDSSDSSGGKDIDTISKNYGLSDTITYTRDKLTAVIKSIKPGVTNEQEQELFPPIITAPTIPESVIVDQDRVDDTDGNFKVDSLILQVINLSDSVLTDLFAVKQSLCGQKFEVKINNVRFVGHPIALKNSPEITTFNVVFALKANSSHDIVNCYHEACQRISIGLLAEEVRTKYLSGEVANMLQLHRFDEHHDNYDDEFYDQEVMSLTNVSSPSTSGTINEVPPQVDVETARKSFKIECLTNILNESPLAATLKQIFDDITITGTSSVVINKTSLISFCLPQKVHQLLRSNHSLNSSSLPLIGPSEITKALEQLRPFHGILLLNDYSNLLLDGTRTSLTSANHGDGTQATASPQGTSDTIRIVTKIRPTRNLLDLSKETGLSLKKIFHVVSSLVYWGKGFIIYPICLNNVYSVHPLTNTCITSKLITDFGQTFSSIGYNVNGKNLVQFLSLFGQEITVKQLQKVTGLSNIWIVNLLVWCLKHQLLLQRHTYVTYFGLDCFDTSAENLDTTLGSSLSSLNIGLSQEYDDDDDNDEANDQFTNEIIISSPKVINTTSRVSENVLRSVIDNSSEPMDAKEKESILKEAVDNLVKVETLELFLKLKKYFDGTRHLEDIMFNEQIERKRIMDVIDSFDTLLCTSQSEDCAVAQLSPYFHNQQ